MAQILEFPSGRARMPGPLDQALIAVQVGKGFFNQFLMDEVRRLRAERGGQDAV
jgi:hypothetical protein